MPPTVRRMKAARPVHMLAVALICFGGAGRLDAQVSVASPARELAGRILGVVSNTIGVPQMGAAVVLLDPQDRIIRQASTDERGSFSFSDVLTGAYSMRVTLASFLPAFRGNILVQPGSRQVINISLSGLLTSIDLVYPAPEKRAVMNDDWKWVLRTSSATRPVVRFLPAWNPRSTQRTAQNIFSDTRGLVKVSAGDGGRSSSLGYESDLGTAFAVATSLFGRNQLQVSGNFGLSSQTRMPSAGFRTTYSRDGPGVNPEVTLTMRQLYVPGRVGAALTSQAYESSVPVLRTMSLSFEDAVHLSDALRFDYGFSLDSVTFFDRLNYASPYGRLIYSLSKGETLQVGYSSGAPRTDLSSGTGEGSRHAALQSEVNALALFPRVSLLGGRAKVQRSENYEVGYTRVMGSRTLRAAAYKEETSNTALTMAGAGGLYSSADALPDLFSNSAIFNAGNYQSLGYMASLTQDVSDRLHITLLYGSGGALVARGYELTTGNPDELRAMIRRGRRRGVATEVAGTAPLTATQFVASYQWSDRQSATPTHFYVTQGMRAEAGLNVYLRQPIPAFTGLPVRLEASADLRNLLAEGYLPFSTIDGRSLYLMHTPRSFRGGLSFIF
ncbi:MAG: TonB-dependent receptor [Bryobacteraceae bacterium]